MVVGGIANSDGSVSLAEWSKGVLTSLGVPPGLPSHDFNIPRVFGINDCGAVVGTIAHSAGDLPSRWFICDRGRFTVLPLADPTDRGGAAVGINNRGEVVGYDHTASNRVTGWLWSNGAYSRLPVSGTSTPALGINSGGTIIGNRSLRLIRRLLTGQLRSHGRTRLCSEPRHDPVPDWVCLCDKRTRAKRPGAPSRMAEAMATVFNNGIATVILSLPSSAVGINSAASVVGSYQPAGYDRRHLFRWSANSGAFDLTPDGYRFCRGGRHQRPRRHPGFRRDREREIRSTFCSRPIPMEG